MKIELFQETLHSLVLPLGPILDLGDGFRTHGQTWGSAEPTFEMSQLAGATRRYAHAWPGAYRWPNATSIIDLYAPKHVKVTKRDEKDDLLEWRLDAVLYLPMGELGYLHLYFQKWQGQHHLFAWSYERKNYGCTALLAFDDDQDIHKIAETFGSTSAVEAAAPAILSRLENAVGNILSAPEVSLVKLNRAHAEGLDRLDGTGFWELLPWFSVNQYSKQLGTLGDCPVSWESTGPFDTLKVSITADTTVTIYTAIVINRNQVVQSFIQVKNRESHVMTTPEQAETLWHTLDHLFTCAQSTLRTQL